MTIEVIIGCHADDDQHRRAARDWIIRWYTARDYTVTVHEITTTPWCKADAYNGPVAASDAEVVVLADADSFVPQDALQQCLDQVDRSGWAAPFTKVHRLTEQATVDVLALDPAVTDRPGNRRLAQTAHDVLHGGGICVMRRDLALSCGPFDPRFVGWGGEDYALGCAARTFAGDYPFVHRGALWHLWHPPQPRTTERDQITNRLGMRYRIAKFQPDAMQALIAEWRT